MRLTGLLLVAVIFVAVALAADVVIRALGWQARDFALVAAAIAGSQAGAVVWHRQSPASAERSVKLGLGALLSVTAVAFGLTYQSLTGWLAHPEAVVPVAAVGCFAFPFAVVGPVWKALARDHTPNGDGAESDTAANQGEPTSGR